MSSLAPSGRVLAWITPVFAEAAALGRSIAFAWSLGADELGKAMMLALTVRLVEMASDVGIDRLIVQAPDGNSSILQANLQAVMLVRGILNSVLIIALAPFLAGAFSSGPSATSYSILAVIPFLRGFMHLDFRRAERHRQYARLAIVEGGATMAMLMCVLPAAWLLNDYRAMSVTLVVHAMVYTGLSQLVAHRRYRVRFSRASALRAWKFGAPLILNAVLLFFTFYADRLIVAGAYDWATLALYGVALQLALLPAQIVGRAAASLVLPRLREALRVGRPTEIWQSVVIFHLMLGSALALGFALLAPVVIATLYGPEFTPDVALALALGIAAGFRVLRTPYSQLAIVTGRTGDPARANIVRAVALVPAILFATLGWPLTAIAVAAAIGEAGATLRAMQLAQTPSENFNLKRALV